MPTPIPVLLSLLNDWQVIVPANLANASAITANRHRQVEQRSIDLVEAMITSYRHVNDLIPISDIFNLQVILDGKEPLITPKLTAFNRDFTAFPAGGVSVIVPRSDDPRFTDDRTPINNSVSTIKIQNNAVTNEKLADMPPFTIKGNNINATNDPIDLTIAQVQTMLGIQPPYNGINSITLIGSDFQLVNDVLSPANSSFYGTDELGVKGYHSLADVIQDIIDNSLIALPGDNWGSQVVQILSATSTPNYPGPYFLLDGTGVLLDPLKIDGQQLENLIQAIIDNQTPPPGDNWGTQVVETDQSSNLLFTYSLLAGNGTGDSPLTIQGGALQAFINDVIASNPALSINDWGSQVAVTSGIVTGNGLPGTPIRLVTGSGVSTQFIKWNHIAASYQLVSPAQVNSDILNAASTAPILGNGTALSPIRIQSGTNNNDTLLWNQGLGQWEVQPTLSMVKYVETIAPLLPSAFATVTHNLGTEDIVVSLTSGGYHVMISRLEDPNHIGLFYEVLNNNQIHVLASALWVEVNPIKVVIIA